MNDIKSVTFFMEECKRMGLDVLGPDVNESHYKFAVNENYQIRFGIGAIKGVGEGAVNTIIAHRKDGHYKSIFDMAKRIDLRAANKRAFENLALAGGFDCFTDTHRAQYFHHEGDGITFLEKAIRYGAKFQENENSAQVSLFGDSSEVQIPEPIIPNCDEWTTMEKLAKEKEVVGIYISGHPLDDFKFELKHFCNVKLQQLKNLNELVGRTVTFGGMITNPQFKTSAKGKDWAIFTIEGYDESLEMRMYNEDYLKYRHFLVSNTFVYFKVLIKEGWIKKDTNERSEPRLQFIELKLLNEVIPTFAKKLIIQMDVRQLKEMQVEKIRLIMEQNPGNKAVVFEVFELEEIQSRLQTEAVQNLLDTNDDQEITDELFEEPEIEIPESQYVRKNLIEMPSKNMRIEISSDLLEELERMQVSFRLN